MAEKIVSWARLKIGQIIGVHMRGDTEEDASNWWESVHRAGKVALQLFKKDPVREIPNNQ